MSRVTACVSTLRGENDAGSEVYRKRLRLLTPSRIRSSLLSRGWDIVDDDENETCFIRPSDLRMIVVHHAPMRRV